MPDASEILRTLTPEERAALFERARARYVAAPSIARESRSTYPLSFNQERLWFLQTLEEASSFYSETQLLELRGAVDIGALERSVLAVLARHEVLRSVIVDRGVERDVERDAERVQEVRPVDSSVLSVETVTGGAAWEVEVANRAAEQSRTVFDLARGPLLRVRVLRGDTSQTAVIVTAHHLVADGWSVGIFLRELGALYSAARGEAVTLPPVAVQYGAYAAWQRVAWARGAHDAGLAYWRERLTGVPIVTLPTDRPRPAVQQYTGAEQRVRYDAALVERLQARSRAAGTTLFMTLLAAWQIWLARQTGETDLPVGTAMANRPRAELEGVIGFFANTVVIRTQWTGNQQLGEVLEQVRVRTLEALAHQDVPFEKVVEAVQPERDLSRMPLAQVMFVLQNLPVVGAAFAGLEVRRRRVPRETTKFDVTLIAEERDGGVEAAWIYNAALYDAATVAGWTAQYARVLEALSADPTQRVDDVSLLTASDAARLAAWNDTVRSYPTTPLSMLVAGQAHLTPTREAVVAADGVLTYEELRTQARQLAWWLRAQGIGAETIVGLHAERVRGVYAALLGVLQAGGAYLPLDPLSPPARLQRVLNEAQPALVLSTMVEQLAAPLGTRVIDLHAALAASSQATPVALPDLLPSQAAYVLYTSGSTGQPKGTIVTHGSLANLTQALRDVYWAERETLALGLNAPLTFDSSVKQLVQLAFGATLHVIPDDVRLDPHALLQFLAAHRLDAFDCTPLQLALLLDAGLDADEGWSGRVFVGGDRLTPGLWARLMQSRRCTFVNMYGPTECTADTSTALVGPQPEPTIGRPLPNVRIYVVDRSGQPVPIGMPGEIAIGGAGVSRGYLANPASTAQAFVPDPFASEPGARIYRSGDFGRFLQDGRVEFKGRGDDQVKVRGYRIELGEIRSAIRQHPGVSDAFVRSLPGADGETEIEAFVASAPGQRVDVADLRRSLTTTLPGYMLPARLIGLDALPLNERGKIDVSRLPVGSAAVDTSAQAAAPLDASETILLDLFAEVLHVPSVGTHDNFFERGGHSLSAARLISRIRQVFDTDLPLRAVFATPTVAGLAAQLRSSGLSTAPAAPIGSPREVGALVPLTVQQRRIWFLDRLGFGGMYHVELQLRVSGELDVTALQRALDACVARHEILRSVVAGDPGNPMMRVCAASAVPLRVLDRRTVPTTEESAHALIREEWRTPIDLQQAPLLRAVLVSAADHQSYLGLSTHHLVADGFSADLLLDDLAAAYAAVTAGIPDIRPQPEQYGDFAVWQQRQLDSTAIRDRIEGWRRALAGVQPLELPTDRPRSERTSMVAGSVDGEISLDAIRMLRATSAEQHASLFMTLLAVFQVMLTRFAGPRTRAIGIPSSGRSAHAFGGAIGCFVNTLPISVEWDDAQPFAALVAAIRERVLVAIERQDVPFEQIVQAVRPPRIAGMLPLVQVMFSYSPSRPQPRRIGALEWTPLDVARPAARFDLECQVVAHERGARCRMLYDSSLFDAATAQAFLDAFLEIASAASSASATTLRTLRVPRRRVSEDAIARELVASNASTASAGPTLLTMFAETVARQPEAEAVRSGERVYTFSELQRASRRLARHLIRRGVTSGARVAVAVPRSTDLLVALLAVLEAGAAYVPIDPEYPQERIRYMLESAGVRAVVSSLAPIANDGPWTRVSLDADRHAIEAESDAPLNVSIHPAMVAYVIFTSGSSGRPKGVEVPHGAVANCLSSMARRPGLAADDVLLALTTVSFDIAALELFLPLVTGARLVIAGDATAAQPSAIVREIERCRATVVQGTPTLWKRLIDDGLAAPDRLRAWVGGEPLPRSLAETIVARARECWNLYGPTEATIWVTASRVDPAQGIDVGDPVDRAAIYVLDGTLEPTAAGAVGEVFIGGAPVAHGYASQPALTAAAFLPDPFGAAGSRMYRTGDLARVRPRDRALELLGRRDRQVKLRGARIEIEEIERVIEEHPDVRAAVVAVMPLGDRDVLAGYVVPARPGLSADIVRDTLARRLPHYMIPSAFVFLAELPTTANGKIDRARLPVPITAAGAVGSAAPVGPIETQLAAIWTEVLDAPAIGADQNFFDAGGHSLLLFRVQQLIAERLDRRVSLLAFFRHPTVRALAQHLAAGDADAAAALVAERARAGQRRQARGELLRRRR